MTRKDIARVLSDKLGFTQRQTGQIVQNLFDAIVNALVDDGRVELRNFGVFEVQWRKARPVPQPAHRGKRVMVPKRCTVIFKPGLALEELVRAKCPAVAAGGRPDPREKSRRQQAHRGGTDGRGCRYGRQLLMFNGRCYNMDYDGDPSSGSNLIRLRTWHRRSPSMAGQCVRSGQSSSSTHCGYRVPYRLSFGRNRQNRRNYLLWLGWKLGFS